MSRLSFFSSFVFLFMMHINRAKEYDTSDIVMRFFLNVVLAPFAWLVFQFLIGAVLRSQVPKNFFEKALTILFAPLSLPLIYFYFFLRKGVFYEKSTYEYIVIISLLLVVFTMIATIVWSKQLIRRKKILKDFYSVKEWIKLIFKKFMQGYADILKPKSKEPVYLPFVFKVLLLLNTLLLLQFGLYDYSNFFQFLLGISFSFLFIFSLGRLTSLLASNSIVLAYIISFFFVLIYFVYVIFSVNQGYLFDLSLFLQNSSLLFDVKSLQLFWDKTNKIVFIIALLLLAWIVLNTFFRERERVQRLKPREYIFVIPALFLPFFSIVAVPDVCYYLVNSVFTYHDQQNALQKIKTKIGKDYPYITRHSYTRSHKDLPNIILLTVESFNGILSEQFANQKKISPFFKELRKKGLSVKYFYGNSIQTARGLFSVYAGVLPSYRKKVFTDMSQIALYGLPRLLQNNGYYTIHFNGHEEPNFDNADAMMKHLGFQKNIFISQQQFPEIPQEKFWGWGIQDDELYKIVFHELDTFMASNPQKPFFAGVMTISNHMMFNSIPDEQKYIYSQTSKYDLQKNITNSAYLVDKNLEFFWREFQKKSWSKNTILVITGDHSFPLSGHNEVGFSEENFRIPFVLIFPQKIKPQRIEDEAFSQIDIAPTLLDIIGLQETNHFTGKSILQEKNNTALLSQPYNGTYLVAVQYPYKLIQKLSNGNLQLYNLQDDPLENENLIYRNDLEKIQSKLKEEIHKMFVNQYLLENDLIWVKPEE